MKYDLNLTVKEVKEALKDLPDDMQVIVPVVNPENLNEIYSFHFVRSIAVLHEEYDEDVVCLAPTQDGHDITSNLPSGVKCIKLLW